MPRPDELVLVVQNNVLFNDNDGYFEGFMDASKADYMSTILKNHSFMRHDKASLLAGKYKQPIAYCAIVNPTTKKVYVYTRASGAEGDAANVEKLLQGNISFGAGGHMVESAKGVDVIVDNKIRELAEETDIQGSKQFQFFGYINNDDDRNNGVGKVHFGLMYLVITDATVVRPLDKEAQIGGMVHISDLERTIRESRRKGSSVIVEPWSEISFEPLMRYLGHK
jgi:predicted NUDIX family phosphoesterase